jgi:hypothetical protein
MCTLRHDRRGVKHAGRIFARLGKTKNRVGTGQSCDQGGPHRTLKINGYVVRRGTQSLYAANGILPGSP